jgi:hypothetical protein
MDLGRTGLLELAGLDGALELHRVGGRLGEVDVQLVDLLHGGQQRGLARTDQAPRSPRPGRCGR